MRHELSESLMERKGEKGAALVMALLVSFLLLVASAGLLLTASMNTQNMTDATAEQQAYNAAESGIQSVVNVLRYKCTAAVSPCKVKPSPLIDTSLPDYNKKNTITYSKALSATTSNKPGDAASVERLSRWINYLGTAATDRVKLAPPSVAYNASSGYAYTLEITDPDNTANQTIYNTTGIFYDHDTGNTTQKTWGTGANTVKVVYTPKPSTTLNFPDVNPILTDFGTFTFTSTGTGAAISTPMRFEVIVNITAPQPATRVMRGWIEMNSSPYTNPPMIMFDSQTYTIRGSDLDLAPMAMTYRNTGSAPFGYEKTMAATTLVSGTLSPPEPDRLRVRSTGFGPRGATKTLEAIIQSNYFNGLGAPATITMVGVNSASNGNFIFDPGNSNAMLYSGADSASGSTDIIPPIGVTAPPDPITGDDLNLDAVTAAVGGHIANNVQGTPSNVNAELPQWMSSPSSMDATVRTLYNTAVNSYDATNSSGRYFPSGTQPTTWGDNATGTGITFCDGDCTLGPVAGGGLLVVTGTLTLHGNFSFNGLIIVTGSGGVIRNGGGNGTIQGNIIVAPYDHSQIADNLDPATTDDFLAPQQ